MKCLSYALRIGLFTAICGFAQVQSTVEPRGDEEPLAVYPWSPDSAFQKVPKALLEDCHEYTLIYDNPQNLRIVPSRKWLRILGVAELEDRIIEVFMKAQEDYYLEQKKHLGGMHHVVHDLRTNFDSIYELVPVDAPDADHVLNGLKVSLNNQPLVETVTFAETPFYEEGKRIKEDLNQALNDLIGPERTARLWKHPHVFFGDFPMMQPKPELPPARADGAGPTPYDPNGPRFWVFRLETTGEARRIRYHEVKAGSIVGRAIKEYRDAFLPDDMQPIIKRWRKNMKEHNERIGFQLDKVEKFSGTFRDIDQRQLEVNTESNLNENRPEWNPSVDYFFIQKNAILDLKISGFDSDGILSQPFASLFGLTTLQEVNQVKRIYDEFQSRFESLELNHFKVIDPKKHFYELKPFPDEALKVMKDFRQALEHTFGSTRGILMSKCLHISPNIPMDREWDMMMEFIMDQQFDQSTDLHPYQSFQLSQWANWLRRGHELLEISATIKLNEENATVIEILFTPSEGQEIKFTVSPEKLPNPLRHLLLPILDVPIEGAF